MKASLRTVSAETSAMRGVGRSSRASVLSWKCVQKLKRPMRGFGRRFCSRLRVEDDGC
jgi:hypothetical protein